MAALAVALTAAATVAAVLPANVSIAQGLYTRTVSYDGQQLVRCAVSNSTKSEVMQSLHEHFDVFGSGASGSLDIRIDSADRSKLESIIGQQCEVLIGDIESATRSFEAALEASRSESLDWFDDYHTYEEIIEWYKEKADEFPLITKLVPSIGKSHEGRDMPAFHITGTAARAKKHIWFQCQIHAREWISGATCQYVVDHLVKNYGVSDEVTKLLDEVELIVIPFVNPDGYAYTWKGDRLWRKNRSTPPTGSACYGTDLNRNYDDHWGQGGSSTSPCSDTYMGKSVASEPEVQAAQDYFKLNRPIYGAIDWHSYSQLLLRPYGWSRTRAPDETMHSRLGDLMKSEIQKVHGQVYTSQASVDLYPTTGSASDWFYGEDASAGSGTVRAYAYTIELRDTGRYGFQLPQNQIIPQGQEMIPPVLEFLRFVTANPLKY